MLVNSLYQGNQKFCKKYVLQGWSKYSCSLWSYNGDPAFIFCPCKSSPMVYKINRVIGSHRRRAYIFNSQELVWWTYWLVCKFGIRYHIQIVWDYFYNFWHCILILDSVNSKEHEHHDTYENSDIWINPESDRFSQKQIIRDCWNSSRNYQTHTGIRWGCLNKQLWQILC